MSERRVVITGMGVVSPNGNTKEEFWKNLLAGNGTPVAFVDFSDEDWLAAAARDSQRRARDRAAAAAAPEAAAPAAPAAEPDPDALARQLLALQPCQQQDEQRN
jgi:3-oxoacyl-(acyl-carrier-protein) synthase